MELVNGADSDQITPTYLLDANGYNVRVGPFPKDRRTGASSASPTMPYNDTTTSASSPVEGPGCESHHGARCLHLEPIQRHP